MLYRSTRGLAPAVSSARAIVEGLAPDGGLYTMAPSELPRLDMKELYRLDTYALAARLLSALLPDFSEAQSYKIARAAYAERFPSDMTPLVKVGDVHFLELYHGPSSAFKDVALSALPLLMHEAALICGEKRDIYILTATSGDTGKAAMEGFRDAEGIKILVFYPKAGVSAVQLAQMRTQRGGNVRVCAVEGNFDDAQSGVKRIFERTKGEGLSSANSINIGRLVPQLLYYFSAYLSLAHSGEIVMGDKVDFTVPTGNFGDILAGFLAKQLGLPVGRLICASNENRVLCDFIRSGVYDRRRPFHKTLSPSMDILISSNLERLLYLLSADSSLVRELMGRLNSDGHYEIPSELLEKIQSQFYGDYCSDAEAKLCIRELWEERHYLCDTHTAVAYKVAHEYLNSNMVKRPMVVLSTASPYKFPAAVLEALGEGLPEDEFDALNALHKLCNIPIPKALEELGSLPVLHKDCVLPEDMEAYVDEWRRDNA